MFVSVSDGKTFKGEGKLWERPNMAHLSVESGEGNRISEKGKARDAGCLCASRTHSLTHARTYARLRECDKLCEEAGHDIG